MDRMVFMTMRCFSMTTHMLMMATSAKVLAE